MSCHIRPLHRLLLLLLLLFSVKSIAQADINTRFNVHWREDEPGNCHGHEDTLNRWLQEAIDLTGSSLQAFDIASDENAPSNGYDHAERTKVFLEAFWGLDSGSNLEDVDLVRGKIWPLLDLQTRLTLTILA